MDEEVPNAEIESSTDENNENESAAVAVVADVEADGPVSSIEKTSDIFKLDNECFDAMFDYSSMEDVISIGKTCKRLQQVAGSFFDQNYSGIQITSNSNGFELHHIDVTHFAEFIRRVIIYSPSGLKYLLNVPSTLQQLKEIEFRRIELNQPEIDVMQETLNCKVEILRLKDCKLDLNEIIVQCPNLKRLDVEYCTSSFDWHLQLCPNLEYLAFSLFEIENESIEKVAMFLNQNPNIQKFATKADYLWENGDFMKNASGIQLDEFAIEIDSSMEMEFAPFCQLLNELHECEVYKRLHLYIWGEINQEMADQLPEVNGLVKLFVSTSDDSAVLLPTLDNLDELFVDESSQFKNLESVANDFINLKRIHFWAASSNDILPFIKATATLDRIRVDKLECGTYFDEDTNALDLVALNTERQQLEGAQKITLYVSDHVYLATKWASRETEFDFICLKRLESFEWNHDFEL